MESISDLFKKYKIKLDSNLDQHFLIDKKIIRDIINSAHIKKTDIILEIGAGTGILTRELAKKSKKIIAIEIDGRFKPFLKDLPKNAEIIFGNARKYLIREKREKSRKFNKIVSNIPYNLCEPLLHYLNFAEHIESTILTVPEKFVEKIRKNPVFSAFLKIEVIRGIPKESFYPIPKKDSKIVKIIHRPDYEKDGDFGAFIRRKLYFQEDKKLKNGLLNIIINLYRLLPRKKFTKKEAKEIIQGMKINKEFLETKIEHFPLEEYENLPDRLFKATS